mgnify:CR=1 FL=1
MEVVQLLPQLGVAGGVIAAVVLLLREVKSLKSAPPSMRVIPVKTETKLDAVDSVEEALAQWDEAQTAAGKRLVVLGQQMEQAWIWAAADFAQMEPTETEQWFKTAVTFPEEFSYEK